ncbi:MAG: hypothetical protein ABSB82_13030 [Terriglobia bacterium]|jgi:hypothetical protein
MELLNRLEKLPHRFFQLPGLRFREIQEALNAFAEGRECAQLQPFTERLDESLTLINRGLTRFLLKYSLAQSLFDLWRTNPEVLQEPSTTEFGFCELIGSDRAQPVPSFEEYFVTVYGRVIEARRFEPRPKDMREFARWLCDKPTRCPSLRLTHEVYYDMVKDKSRPTRPNDLADLTHVLSIPHVDLLTLDRNMRHYAAQACVRTNSDWRSRICENAQEILTKLSGGGAERSGSAEFTPFELPPEKSPRSEKR